MTPRIVILTGGVGGAKLVLGLMQIMPPSCVTAIVNTGDDFRHLGLPISPDIDTLLYTLAGKANAAQSWGREGETWSFLEAVRTLGGPDWFALGDGDLALHVMRNHALAQGRTLSEITADFTRAWKLGLHILPMSDDPVATCLTTDQGELTFQDYFVARRCAPVVSAIRFSGVATAHPAPGVLAAIAAPETAAILIAPSNPYLSIDPILAIPGLRAALQAAKAPVVAVSPVIGGKAVKGPTAKLMQELGVTVNARAIAAHYHGILDAILVDQRDTPEDPGIAYAVADTLMITLDDRIRVAQAALNLARRTVQTK
jgi:LPPG:FO 2-phospho-L-lactate transferase